MTSFDYPRLWDQARDNLLAQGSSPRKMIIVHSGVTIGMGLILSILSYLLERGVAGTGGLDGIGTRAVLETVQVLLQGVNLILMPFWTVGYIAAIMSLNREERVGLPSLLWGFRHWGVVLRSLAIKALVYMGLILVGAQLASAVFFMTPSAEPLYAVMEEMIAAGVKDPYAMMEDPAYMAASMAVMPYALVGILLIMVPVFYRLRFIDYALAESPGEGAIRAVLKSFRITRKKTLSLFLLDLRFWWFYLAQILIVVLGAGDLLLPMLGVELKIGGDAAMFVFYIAGLVCEFGLYVWQKNQVSSVYALAYSQLAAAAATEEEKPNPKPQRVPWSR